MSNEEYILDNLDKIEDLELKKAIVKLLKENNELLDNIKLDHLTGAYNRRILEKVRNYDVVVMCDIDSFKKINDTYGHDAGDEVLRHVVKIFLNNTRINDVVCRYGGDEFLLIFTGCDEKVVINRFDRMSKEIENCVPFTNVTLSVGVTKGEPGKRLETAITEADRALYKSKENAKNKITIYDNEMKLKLSK